MCRKIRFDGKSKIFGKIFWKLNKAMFGGCLEEVGARAMEWNGMGGACKADAGRCM